MSITFNADEIFEIAEQIERNGAQFYRNASGRFTDPAARDKLLDLAVMEDDHEKTFAEMRMDVSVSEKMSTSFDPDSEAVLFLQSIADGKIFNIKKNPSEILAEGITIEEILKQAIELEKDSVVFYTGIREMLSEKIGKKKVNDIINEEIGHIFDLGNQLSALS